MQFHGPGDDWSRAPAGPGHGERGSGKYRAVYGEEHAEVVGREGERRDSGKDENEFSSSRL